MLRSARADLNANFDVFKYTSGINMKVFPTVKYKYIQE